MMKRTVLKMMKPTVPKIGIYEKVFGMIGHTNSERRDGTVFISR